MAGMAFAQVEVSTVAEQVYGNALYYEHTPNIARSTNNDLVAVWNDYDGQVVFSKYDAAFLTWSPAVAISNAGDEAVKAGIVADHSGNIYCVWQQRNTSDEDWAIYLSQYSGASWSTPVNLTGNTAENEECAIGVNDLDHIFVAWNTDAESDGAEYVLCAKSEDGGTNWSTPDTLSSADGVIGGTSTTSGRPVLAAATGGKMVCAWHEEPDGHPDRESYMAQYDGATWSDEIVHIDVADSANSMYPTIAADSEDNIYLMYVSFVGIDQLKMIKKAWGDATWPNPADSIMADDMLTKPNLVTDTDDNMYVCFRRDNAADTTYGLEEAAYMASQDKGATWSEQVRLSTENHDAGYESVAFNVTDAGVDFMWREIYKPFVDEGDMSNPDTVNVMHARIDLLTSIENNDLVSINGFELKQNYPNPFNPETRIAYTLPVKSAVTLTVYNLIGQEVRILTDTVQKAGPHTIKFNARGLASGLYFYQLKAEGISLTKKMIIMQ